MAVLPESACRRTWLGKHLSFIAMLLLSLMTYSPGFASFYCLDDLFWLQGAHGVHGVMPWVHWLFKRETEHMALFSKLFIFFFYKIFGLSYALVQMIALAEFWTALLLLWALSAYWFRSRLARCTLVGVMATTGLFHEAIVWFSGTIFLVAFIFTLLALLGVEWFGQGRTRAGLIMVLAGAFFAPMGNLVGLPCGLCVLIYAILRLRMGHDRPWRDSLLPGMLALAGTAAFLAFYLWNSPNLLAHDAMGARGSLLGQVRLGAGMKLALEALWRFQWGGLIVPISFSSYLLMSAACLSLIMHWSHVDKKKLACFIAWSFSFLTYVLMCRTWAGVDIIKWGRYHLFPALGTAGVLALAVDASVQARVQRCGGMNPRIMKRILGVFLGVLFILNAALSSWTIWSSSVLPVRRFVKAFCEEWGRFPGEYSRYSGKKQILIPDVQVSIPGYAFDLPLSSYEFCWPRQHDWTVVWTSPSEPFSKESVDYLTNHSNLGAVRHFLRETLYPETYGKARRQ